MTDPAALARGRRVGLLGGSFNPAHGGHVEISDAARHALRLDRVWWLVSPQNPLKDPASYLPLAERVAQAAALTRTRVWLRVSGIEAKWGTQFTVDTLRQLTRRYPATRFVWIMGADSLAGFHRWKHWQEIAQMVPICVVSRPGASLAALNSPAARALRSQRRYVAAQAASAPPPQWIFLSTVHNPTSATAIRQRGA